MPGQNLVFYGTTGVGGTFDGDAESDPNNYLGRFRSSTPLHDFQSTLTAGQTTRTRHIIEDNTRIGDGADVHALKWLLMQTGTNALSFARIMAFDDATGRFKLDRRLGPGTALATHAYAVFDRQNVFPDVTPAQAVGGDERFRCIALRNEHGFTLTNVRFRFEPISVGGFMSSINQAETPLGGPYISRADDVTDVLDNLGQRFPNPSFPLEDGFRQSSAWITALADSISPLPTSGLALDVFNNNPVAIWLRRRIPANFRFRRSVAFIITVESDVGGSSPDPLAGSAIISFDVAAETPAVTLEADRFVHILGGARMRANVATAGQPVVERPVRFDVRSGDAGVIVTDDDPIADFDTTDENGDAFATFFGSTNPADEGQLTHPQAIVGAGDEVGNP